MNKGKVFLVGAGPGDPALLTLRGKQLLETAQVVVYDRLVGQGVLDMIPPHAKRIDVGKNAGHHPVPQEEINQILVREALAGQQVVRLKGGDSFLFGRGGEELEELVAHGLPFEVVPGITSALAAPAYGGIPVTHRDYCSSLHIITGHKRQDETLTLDYDALVRLNGTLVFLMSVSSLPQIAQGLLSAGMSPDMPCALVENGTRPQQRTFTAPLGQIVAARDANQVVSPAIILVGRVAALHSKFAWFDVLPLKGVPILVTRPRGQSSSLAQGLTQLGAQVSLLPAISLEPLPFALPPLPSFDSLVFTSANGVSHFMAGLLAAGQDSRVLAGKMIAAIGSQTAKALAQYGLCADFVPTEYTGAALAAQMLEQKLLHAGSKPLLVGPQAPSPDLPQALAQAGIAYQQLPVYRTLRQEGNTVDPTAFAWLTFTSASCVEGFAAACPPGTDFTRLKALCIGEKTAQQARQLGLQTTVSPQATIESMIETILGGIDHD